MLFEMAPLALIWSDLERSKSRSRIFGRAITWERLQIGPWLPLALTYSDFERSKHISEGWN